MNKTSQKLKFSFGFALVYVAGEVWFRLFQRRTIYQERKTIFKKLLRYIDFVFAVNSSLASAQKGKVRLTLFSGFFSLKRLGVFLLPSGWDASPEQGYPTIKFAGTIYTLRRGG